MTSMLILSKRIKCTLFLIIFFGFLLINYVGSNPICYDYFSLVIIPCNLSWLDITISFRHLLFCPPYHS